MSRKRILFFSHFFPPALGGSSVLMRNLLAPFPPESLHVIHGQAGRIKIDRSFAADIPQTLVELPDCWGPLKYRLTLLLYPRILAAAFRLHREKPFDAVFTCWPSAYYLEFAYRFHRITGVPLYVYMHDMWADNQRSALLRKMASWYERRVLKAAEVVFAITDAAGEHFRQKYGVRTMTLEHTVDWSSVEKPDAFVDLPGDGKRFFRITCGGAVYSMMNQDSVVRMNQAVQEIPNAEMSICTPVLEAQEKNGLSGERLHIQSLSKQEAFRHFQSSDIVCAPLAFHTHAVLEVKTVFTTKLLDYFICGRPILVHAPADSFLARDARLKGWGYVVDTPDVQALKKGILRILEDKNLQRRLVAAAWQEARRRDSRIISGEVQKFLGVTGS